MPAPPSPLHAIKQKEIELRARTEEVRQAAAARIEAAREQARRTVAEADRAGRAEAEAHYAHEIEAARNDAQDIMSDAHEQASALRQRAAGRLERVAAQIVEMVLPVSSAG